MTEDTARTVHHALQLGQPDIIPPDEVQRAYRRYTDKYGQTGRVAAKVDTST